MPDITQTCRLSGKKFVVTQAELDFLEKISPEFNGTKYVIPPATVCPEERMRRRLAFRNERKLYNHKCDLSGKQIISMYAPDSPYKVYDQEEWWSDKWDPMEYGQEFDFSRPLFEQFKELQLNVPRVCITNTNSENSVYTNYTGNNKNCYLVFSNARGGNENCMYGTCLANDTSCVDNIHVKESEFCYDCIDCDNCYRLFSSKDCDQCRESYFLEDCKNCSNCIGCKGLRNKEYCIFNQQYSKEEYFAYLKAYNLGSHKAYEDIKEKSYQFFLQIPSRFAKIRNAENCTGNHISTSRNCFDSFDTTGSEDCRYIQYSFAGDKNLQDVSYVVHSEMSYETLSLVDSYHILFSNITWNKSSDLMYCELCFGSQNCFGCVGLKRKEYCIFNVQYTKEQYEELVPKIIEHMRSSGEYGEFFPASLSPFGYNETIAQEVLPLSEEEAKVKGFHWKVEESRGFYDGPAVEVPDHIGKCQDDICKQILTCSETGKQYKVIPQELSFYRDMELPIPCLCPDQRHLNRIKKRNPYHIWERKCQSCSSEIHTPYSPEKADIVYCETCYNNHVYG